MTDYDIHSCGYYCDRHACIVAQRNELRDKLFSEQAVKTYSGGKPNYTEPIEPEPMIDGWPLYSGLPQPEPEPVAVFRREILGRGQIFWLRSSDELPNETPLYTAPPQREWIDLTATEIKLLRRAANNDREFAELVQAKLKEKNT